MMLNHLKLNLILITKKFLPNHHDVIWCPTYHKNNDYEGQKKKLKEQNKSININLKQKTVSFSFG